MTTLPWAAREGLDGLVAALDAGVPGGAARMVGGAVRDALLGHAAADLDLASVHTPEEAIRRLNAAGIRTVPTGLAHGTITALLPSGPVEVTTLRRDVATDGRHATVAFTDDWRADAGRRDFTINALYAEPATGALHDYHGGLADLGRGHVRFIGDPLRRIAEDHLRILRFFRFHARFGPANQALIDADGFAASILRANDLMALSRERIAAELMKLLVAVHAVPVLALMVGAGILRPVLPEIADTDALALLAGHEAAAGIAPDPVRRLAALLPPDPANGDAVAARLKLSRAQRERLVMALTPRTGDAREDAYRRGRDPAIDRLLLARDVPFEASAARALAAWAVPRLPITGGALVARGVGRGPDVARALRRVEDRWIAEGFPDESRVLALADEEADQALRAAISR